MQQAQLLRVAAHWFFNQRRQPGIENVGRHGQMEKMRGGDDHAVHAVFDGCEHFLVIRKNRYPRSEFGGQLGGSVQIGIRDARDAELRRVLKERFFMGESDAPGADESNTLHFKTMG